MLAILWQVNLQEKNVREKKLKARYLIADCME